MRTKSLLLAALVVAFAFPACAAEQPIKVLIIGGQNNHDWKRSTPYMKGILDKAGGFEVSIYNTPPEKSPKEDWEAWRPKFGDYQCVVLDYNGQMWPEEVKKNFVDYVRGGGGVLVIHAANNCFGGWKEYDRMVGLLFRGKNSGCALSVDDDGKVVRDEPNQGRNMGHGGQYDWKMTVRDSAHPITEGMPIHWMHKRDELYHGQRGPAEDLHILITAYSDPAPGKGGTGKNEPIVWWTHFGKGKVVTNVMGHVPPLDCMTCVGFKVVLCRACQWLATGKCSTLIPANFPTGDKTSVEP